ncbi:MAG: prepilin peptidase [Alphaproteobacteria bacterium]|nr:MAG: prepilin peptidase [Alphaproteobacteria bacterium]
MQSALSIEHIVMPLLTIALLVCTAIIVYSDVRFMIIPNAANLAVLSGGLILCGFDGLSGVAVGLSTAVVIFALLWSVRRVHFRATGRVGLGMGDVKFMAAASTWLQIALFPVFLFVASFLGLTFALASKGSDTPWQSRRIPFGPFLASSLVLTWLLSNPILSILELL